MPVVRTVQPNAAAIRALRHQRGLSGVALSAKIGRGARTVHNIELGRRASELLISQIANGLDVDVNEIIIKPDGGVGDEPDGTAKAA